MAVARPWHRRVSGGLTRLVGLARSIAALSFTRVQKAKTLCVYGRTTPLVEAEIREGGETICVVSNYAKPEQARLICKKQAIDDLISLGVRILHRSCPIENEARAIAALLSKNFGQHIDFYAIIVSKYQRHLVANGIWSRLLDRCGSLERVDYVNDDTLKTLVAIARRRGLATREFQHAYMGQSNLAFSYSGNQSGLETLPDQVWVDRYTPDIMIPTQIVDVTPDARATTPSLKDRDIDVLIGGSPTRNDEAMALLRSLVGLDLRVGIKLHPAQTEETSGVWRHATPSQLSVFTQTADFCDLARRSKIYVPANPTSTTAFEAVEAGAQLLVVDFDGKKITSTIDHLVSYRVSSPEALPAVVSKIIDASETST